MTITAAKRICTICDIWKMQKAVFCMRYYQELSYEEISEIMGTSVGALKASYHFAYEKIKKELKEKISV